MPDDDRFAGIGDALEEKVDDEPSDDGGDGPEREGGQEATGGAESDPSPSGGPAFAFDDATQQTVYPRPETWTALRAALSNADAELLTEHGIDDAEGRELHDAALAIAAERPEEIAERVAESRQE